MARINKGSILESRYTYGWECQSYDFYEVVEVSAKGMATLRPLDKDRRYFPGPDGKIYYDTPEEVSPSSETRTWHNWRTGRVEPMPNIRRKIYNFGEDGREYLKPEEYHRAVLWTGKPKDVWNYH